MKNLVKIIVSFIIVLVIGTLFAYKSMLITYDRVNKEQTIVEVCNCNCFEEQIIL